MSGLAQLPRQQQRAIISCDYISPLQFQHRMNKRTMEAVMNGGANAAAAEAENNPNAREFGDQLTKTRKAVRPAAGAATGTTVRRAVPKTAQVKGSGNSAGFAIFCDDGAGSGAAGGSAWESLPSEKERSKENARAASQWTKDQAGTVPQKKTRPPIQSSGIPVLKAGVDFELFSDQGLSKAGNVERVSVRKQLDGALGERKERGGEFEKPLDFLSRNDETEQVCV